MHQIVFRDVTNDWHNALPVGNGRTGAMVFFKEGILHIALNNYDCYYHILPKHTAGNKEDKSKRQTFDDPARITKTYEELCRFVEEAKKEADYGRAHYLKILHPELMSERPSYKGSSYPIGGEILIYLDESVDVSHSCLKLVIEEGKICFSAGSGSRQVMAEVFVPKNDDGVIIEMEQTEKRLWRKAEITVPSKRGQGNYKTDIRADGQSVCLSTAYHSEGDVEPFIQESVFYLPSAAYSDKEEKCLYFSDEARTFSAFAALMPQKGRAAALNRHLEENQEICRREHAASWKSFWTSSVTLPDYFLETLWHLHVYLMECSCAKRGVYPEQAWGLSGLWDIRRPNMWGSMWYWDANIQTAYLGTYSAGHPEITKTFCDGYLSYEQEIREYTKRVYGTEGWALDYPHTLYHCIQPWCAQFLWLYYQYSGDYSFLEKKAYPVFCEQIRFFEWLAQKDENGIFHIEMDLCPEQGTIAGDSVITVACMKKLILAAIEAADILGRPDSESVWLKGILSSLPAYSVTSNGERWKDSSLIMDDLFLRHPSVLMPVFPAEEITWESGQKERRIAEETLKYAVEHTEIGTFGPGWLSMAAAVMRKGTSAQRILYEKLLDYELHSNGLGYEESERFINYCHITKPAHCLPPMIEVSGCIVNTVNLMLLQSGDTIHVFPAVPDGDDGLMEKAVQYREDEKEMEGAYPAWQEAEFTGLMAPGGFVISAQRKGGKTTYIHVKSTRSAELKLSVPSELTEAEGLFLYKKEMRAGEEIVFGKRINTDKRMVPEVLSHEAARTHRRIFVGENQDTAFWKAIDSFVCAYGFANDFRYVSTPYIFDFGRQDGGKNYDEVYHKQSYMTGGTLLYAAGPNMVGAENYDSDKGYGFTDITGIAVQDREGPDDLRRDFLEGSAPVEFKLELPKGRYDFLIISGDEIEESLTTVVLPEQGTVCKGSSVPAGHYQSRILPVVHEHDGEAVLRFEAGNGLKWKINAIFVNKHYAFL